MSQSVQKPDVRRFFSAIYGGKAPSAHEWTAGTASPDLIKLVWEGEIPPGSKVLEVGCGIGTEAVFLAVRGMQVTAVDISESAIKTARDLAAVYGVEVDFRVGDVLNLPFDDNAFDVVTDQGCF